jgi:hypothetical protein
MDDATRFRPGDEHDFEARVRRDPRLHALVTMIEHELHEGRITIDDAVRIGVMGATRYMMHRNVPIRIVVEEMPNMRCGDCANPLSHPCPHPDAWGLDDPASVVAAVCTCDNSGEFSRRDRDCPRHGIT